MVQSKGAAYLQVRQPVLTLDRTLPGGFPEAPGFEPLFMVGVKVS